MLAHDLIDLLEPLAGDECSCPHAFRRWRDLVADLGGVEGEIERLCGFVRVAPVSFFVGRRFDINVQGAETELTTIIGILAEDENLVDAVAWPIDRPDAWATYGRHWPAIGWETLLAHPAEPFANSLRVHRAPWAWLRAGGDGIVPLDVPAAAVDIRAAIERGGRLRFDDDAHASEIAHAIAGLTDLRSLVVEAAE